MNSLFDVASLSNQAPQWLGLLLSLALKGAVILAVASLASVALRRSSAAVRHLVWNLALVGLLALPLLVVVLPRWDVPVLPRLLASPEPEAVAIESAAVSEEAVRAAIQSAERRALFSAERGNIPPETPEAGGAEASHAASIHWSVWVLMLWLVGSLIVSARLAAGLASAWWITRHARAVEDPVWAGLAEYLSRQAGLKRTATLLESERVGMPLTWGLLRSVILLPSSARDWPEERRHVVLSHELAHVRRKDCLTQTLAQAACALYWFNPLVWVAARQLRMERERACDDHVLHTGTRASDYASHLLDIARSLRSSSCSSLTAVAIARRSQLEGRLLAILDPDLSRRGLNRAGASLALLAMICVVLPLAAMRPLASDGRLNNERPREEDAIREARSEPSPLRAEARDDASREAVAAATTSEAPTSTRDEISSEEAGQDQPSPSSEESDGGSIIEAFKDSLNGQGEQAGERQIVEGLKEALKDSDWEVRKQAAWALGLKGNSDAVEPLIETLNDEHPEVREQAAWALGLKGDRRAVRPLVAALKDSEPNVRENAAWALGLKGNGEAVDPLIEALKDSDAQVREQAAWALGLKGDRRAVEPLIAALKDTSPDVREQAAWALGLKGDRSALPGLKEALKDSSNQVREQARWAIGMILMRGGASAGGGDDDKDLEFEFESGEISERVASTLTTLFNTRLKIKANLNVNPNPSPRGEPRNRK